MLDTTKSPTLAAPYPDSGRAAYRRAPMRLGGELSGMGHGGDRFTVSLEGVSFGASLKDSKAEIKVSGDSRMTLHLRASDLAAIRDFCDGLLADATPHPMAEG